MNKQLTAKVVPVTDRIALTVEYYGNKWLRPVGTWLLHRTQGRTVSGEREVVLLTTTGRRSGRAHTVLLQAFPAGEDRVLVAANSGRATDPDWYRNLLATPTARVEARGRSFAVQTEPIPAAEVARLWPDILARAPSYARYRRATRRDIPLVRVRPVAGRAEAPSDDRV